MWVGNIFSHVCLSMFLSVQAIIFETLDIETSFLVCRKTSPIVKVSSKTIKNLPRYLGVCVVLVET